MAHHDGGIFGIGTSGLVGSRVSELLGESYPVLDHSSRTGFDITDPATLSPLTTDTAHKFVLHMAAKTDVDGCEEDRETDKNILQIQDVEEQAAAFRREKTAWAINVLGTKNVVDACRDTGKTLVYISTDFVFSGNDTPEGGYDEDATPAPVNWYATTKYEGEKVVIGSGMRYIVVRIAYPYRAQYAEKLDFVRTVMSRLQDGKPVRAITDHIMTPTFIDDIAFALRKLLATDAEGIYHVVGSEYISPMDAVQNIARMFGFDKNLIEPVTREEFFAGRAPRPFNLSIKNDRIDRLGVEMKTFARGLEEIKKQTI